MNTSASKPRILITEPILDEVRQELQQHFEVDIGRRKEYDDPNTLKEAVGSYDGLLTMLTNPVTKEVLEAAGNLKVIANYAVGYDNIDIEAARRMGIRIATTPGVLSDATADTTWGLILNVTRSFDYAQAELRKGNFDGWHPNHFIGAGLKGKNLGIVGMGRIGTAVAKRARAFGMNILYHQRNRLDQETEKSFDANFYPNMEDMAAHLDVLSLHCPLNEGTHHLVDKHILELLPERACVINTARGAVIDEDALADALHNKTIAGAGLDVYENEPEIHPMLYTAPHCTMLPHIGSGTYQTRKAMGKLASNALTGVLLNEASESMDNLIV